MKNTDKAVRKESIAGLDIGPKEIRVREGDMENSVSMPEHAFSDGVIIDINTVSRAVKDLFKSQGITAKNVVTAVSGKGVLSRLTEVPSMGPEAVKDAIKEEISKYIVFAGSELLTDFYPVEEIAGDGNRRLKILSVAVRKEIVGSYVETIKLAGLNLQAIDVRSLSLARAVFSQESLSTKGIVILAAVEIDCNSAAIFIFKDGKIHYLHNVDALSELNSEMESIVGYCKNEFGGGVEIKKIISAGLKDISAAKGLFLRGAEEAGFPVKINLLPLEEIRIKEFKRQALWFLRLVVVVLSVLVLWFFFLRFQTWLAVRDTAAIQDELANPDPALEKLLEVERMSKLYALETAEQRRIILRAESENWGKILREIGRVIPKDAYLVGIKSDGKNIVVFEGKAAGQNSVFDFVLSLKNSACFEDIQLEESKDEENTGAARTYFVIKCRLKAESGKDE